MPSYFFGRRSRLVSLLILYLGFILAFARLVVDPSIYSISLEFLWLISQVLILAGTLFFILDLFYHRFMSQLREQQSHEVREIQDVNVITQFNVSEVRSALLNSADLGPTEVLLSLAETNRGTALIANAILDSLMEVTDLEVRLLVTGPDIDSNADVLRKSVAPSEEKLLSDMILSRLKYLSGNKYADVRLLRHVAFHTTIIRRRNVFILVSPAPKSNLSLLIRVAGFSELAAEQRSLFDKLWDDSEALIQPL